MYPNILHVPWYTPCTLAYYMYPGILHVPWYTPCTLIYYMYPGILHVPLYTIWTMVYFMSLVYSMYLLYYMYPGFLHVPRYTPFTLVYYMYSGFLHVPWISLSPEPVPETGCEGGSGLVSTGWNLSLLSLFLSHILILENQTPANLSSTVYTLPCKPLNLLRGSHSSSFPNLVLAHRTSVSYTRPELWVNSSVPPSILQFKQEVLTTRIRQNIRSNCNLEFYLSKKDTF